MNNPTQIFIIMSDDSTKIITYRPWRGVQLEKKSVDEIISSLKKSERQPHSENNSEDNSTIQYFNSYDEAETVVRSLQEREREPILETLKIVKVDIKVEFEDVGSFSSVKLEINKRMMKEFEDEVRSIGKPEYFAESSKKSDYSSFNYVIVQDLYQLWKQKKTTQIATYL